MTSFSQPLLRMFADGGRGHTASVESLQPLQRFCDRQAKAAFDSMNALQIILVVGALFGVLTSIVLALFFCLNITNRLLIIVNNTLSLSKGTELIPPLKGNDEIAELDQFLFKSAKEIRELERFKKEMIGVVSHELKSPLTSVGGFLTSLSNGVFGEMTTKAQDKVQRTCSSVSRLMGLVSELLYLDRLELDMNPEEIPVDELLSVAIDTVKGLAEQQGVEIISQSTGGHVFADRNRLVQVIVNLLSNALKYSPPQGKVTLEANLRDGWFECRVGDQGRGIPEEFRKQIFEPFKQVDGRDATAKKGTGLGLTISRSIVEQHGGTIGVDSAENKGSTFWFKIPGSAVAPAQKSAPAKSSGIQDKISQHQTTPSQSGKGIGKGTTRKFSVLQKGLVIISIPLIFQIAFASVIGYMVLEVRAQTQREETSNEVLYSLTRMAETLIGSAHVGMMYVYTRNPALLQSWEEGKKKALGLLDHAAKLSVADAGQTKDFEATKGVIEKISATLHAEATRSDSKSDFEKFTDMAGVGDIVKPLSTINPNKPLSEVIQSKDGKQAMNSLVEKQKMMGSVVGQELSHDASSDQEKEGSQDGTGSIAGREKVREMMTSMMGRQSFSNAQAGESGRERMVRMFMGNREGTEGMMNPMRRMMGAFAGMGGMGGMGGLGAMGMIGQMQSLFSNSITVKLVRPFLEGQAAQDRLMDRQRAVGENLARQRADMMHSLQMTLLAGFIVNIILSVLLAFFLMRNLTNRLHHVMENTARLVKRETLDPPLKGNDEISYLDRVLYETGNRLVELETFKRQLISIVSHELRTPLMSISSTLDLLESGALGDLSNKGQSRLSFAQEETNRLIRLITDLLDIEKMEAGKFVLDITEIKVVDSINNSLTAVAQLAEARHITLESQPDNSIQMIWADRDRLSQVFINLLSNAIKYSPENGTIRITSEKPGADKIKFSVTDQGRGIPAEMKEKIFDRFVQVEKADATERGGTGLGLAISKAIVEQHGGTIGVDSKAGEGSTFWFVLPLDHQRAGTSRVLSDTAR